MKLTLLVLAASSVFAAPAKVSTEIFYPTPSHTVFELPSGSDQRLEIATFQQQQAAALKVVMENLKISDSNKIEQTDGYNKFNLDMLNPMELHTFTFHHSLMALQFLMPMLM